MTTKCTMRSWIESRTRKRTLVRQLRKFERFNLKLNLNLILQN